MATLTAQQVYAAARGAGATHDEAVLLTAIAKGESGWNTGAHYKPGTGEDSYGVWQINMDPKYAKGRLETFGIASAQELYDPRVNARAALSLLRSQGPGAWTLYKNGGYKKALPEAQAAGNATQNNWQSVAQSLNQDFGGESAGQGGTNGVGAIIGGTTTNAATGQGGGTTSVPALPPNASPAEIEKYIRENYPQAAGFLEVPEIRNKLIQGAREGWTPQKLEAEIQATTWWRTNSATTRQMFALKSADPAEYQAMLDAKRAELEPLVKSIGYVGDYGPFIEDALKYGWSDAEITQRISAGLQNQSKQMGLTQGSTVDVTADQLMLIARNEYLLPMGRQDLEKWAVGIWDGSRTEEGFREFMGRLSSGRFPGLSDQGITPGEYFAPIRNVIAQTLELQPGDVDLLANQFSTVLESPDGKGGYRPMSISEAQRWARSLPAFRTTKTARDTAADFAENIGRTFGAVA